MKKERFFFPLFVFAAVLAVYLFFRKQDPGTKALQPSTAGSGIPQWATEGPAQYSVPAYQPPVTPVMLMADPYNAFPGQKQPMSAPSYLAFNFGPSHDLTKHPTPDLTSKQKAMKDEGCGCGGGTSTCATCNQINDQYPDGSTGCKMASSTKRLIATQPKSWLEIAQDNFGGQDVAQFLPHAPSVFNPGNPNGPPQSVETNPAPAAPASNIPKAVPGLVAQYNGPALPYGATL